VVTSYGTIKIGWRKHVINIDWREMDQARNIAKLFSKEDVTKGDTHIHADNIAQALDFLKRIRQLYR
jgi:hypothetical protein